MTSDQTFYDILGVKRTATAAEIKAAYKKKVRTAHPDRGGTEEAFIALVAAYDTLSNPKYREIYDRTGQPGRDDPMRDRNEMMSLLAQHFAQMLEMAHKTRQRLKHVNFIKMLTDNVKQNQQKITAELAAMDAYVLERQDLLKRITRNDEEPNLFADVVRQQLTDLQKGQFERNNALRILEMAATELAAYKNEVEMIQALQGSVYGFSQTTASTQGPPRLIIWGNAAT